jgi:hypothetical protein
MFLTAWPTRKILRIKTDVIFSPRNKRVNHARHPRRASENCRRNKTTAHPRPKYNLGIRLAHWGTRTANQYWKRAQAARLIRFHPDAQKLLESGETQVSHLALIAPKITQANSELLLDVIKHKSKKEVALLLSRITPDGDLLPAETTFELRMTLTESQVELLDRAREVLANMRGGGHMPSLPEILVKALEDLLDRRDPRRKAAMAEADEEPEVDLVSEPASPGKDGQRPYKATGTSSF